MHCHASLVLSKSADSILNFNTLKKESWIKEKLECLLLTLTPAYNASENKARSPDQFKWLYDSLLKKEDVDIFIVWYFGTVSYYILQPMLLTNGSS